MVRVTSAADDDMALRDGWGTRRTTHAKKKRHPCLRRRRRLQLQLPP